MIGPFAVAGGFQLILVEEVRKAKLTPAITEAVKDRIYQECQAQPLPDGFRVEA